MGLYYLQSRYYNPEVGRFINADALVATGQGLLGNNMFAYSLNNPVIYMDPDGKRIVAVGIQFEIQGGEGSVGIEIVIYFDPEVCNGEDFVVVAYQYSGVELSASNLTNYVEMIDITAISEAIELGDFTQDALLITMRGIMEGAGLSGAAFVIDGNDSFDDPSDYSGNFETLSISIALKGSTVTGFHSYCPTCTATGIKVGISFPKAKKFWPFPIDLSYARSTYSDPITLW